jgi:hypothetical protein
MAVAVAGQVMSDPEEQHSQTEFWLPQEVAEQQMPIIAMAAQAEDTRE